MPAYLPWCRRRLLQNPSYYDLDGTEPEAVSAYLTALVGGVLDQLQLAGCLEVRGGLLLLLLWGQLRRR